MIRPILTLLFIACCHMSLSAQALYTWENDDALLSFPSFGGQNSKIARVPGNGYLLGGYYSPIGANQSIPLITRLDDQGREMWVREYPYFQLPPFMGNLGRLIPTTDGGFLSGVVGNTIAEWIVKFNSAGDTLWTKKMPQNIFSNFDCIDQLPDGKLIYNIAPATGNPNILNPKLLWTDPAGVPVDSMVYPGLPYAWLTTLRTSKDYNTYISGYDSTTNYSVSKIDSAGVFQWTNNFYTHNSAVYTISYASGSMVAPDSSISLGIRHNRGNSWPNNSRYAWEIYNVSPSGSQNWQITLPDAFGFVPTYFGARLEWTIREDGVLLATLRDSTVSHLLAVSPTGAPLWQRTMAVPPGYTVPTWTAMCPGPENTNTFATAGFHFGVNSAPFGTGYDSLGNFSHALVQGRVFADSIANCIQDPGENGLPNCLILGSQGNLEAITDVSGDYSFVAGVGSHTFTAFPVANNWAPVWDISCPISDSITVTHSGTPSIDTIVGQDFAMEKLLSCAMMVVDVATPFLRFCDTAVYYVNYCNQGTETALNSYVVLALDTAFSGFTCSLPYTMVGLDSFRVDLGNLAPGQCGQFFFHTIVPCVLPFNPLTYCVTAHAFPDSICGPTPANWNGAHVEVEGWCAEQDTIWFRVRNTGTAAMSASSGIWVVEDDILRQTGQILLNAGQDSSFFVLGNGSTWATLVDQVPNYPWPSIPRAIIEACGTDTNGGISTGFVTHFEEDDQSPWLAIDCHQVITAIDPNDKTGFPNGFGAQNRIYPNGEMEYLIRFQNTGTDTAFKVTIRDILPPHLNLQSFVSGASSHPYTLNFLPGNAVEWTFDNILLPDSNVNESLSHGFVKFRMMQNANLPDGTLIENEAGIIFDYMPPVITNTAFHTIGELELMVSIEEQQESEATAITVYPNPCVETAHFDLGKHYKQVSLQVYDLNGRLVRAVSAGNARQVDLDREGLTAGMYVFRITSGQDMIGSGKLIVRNR